MYAYIDESGNTGYRIFDPEQPVFVTAAMMTKTNFDALRKRELERMAHKVGATALHANELGVARIEEIAEDLLRVIKGADARFFVSRVEKRYLAAAKVYDTYFDAGENLAVPWSSYWIRPLRLILMFKIAHFVLTEEIAQIVWECVTATSQARSREYFLRAAQLMLDRAHHVPDARSRQVISEALDWALNNPENFSTHLRDKLNRNGHTPNFVAFTNVMRGITHTSTLWRRPVREIVHDRQSQFEKTLEQWHALFSRPELADQEPVRWPGEDEPMNLSCVPSSQFRFATEEDSPGLQVIDVVLWLFKRVISDKEIGPRGSRFLKRVFQRAYQDDLSFDGVGSAVTDKLDDIWQKPITDEQAEAGRGLLAKIEQNRITAMSEYAGTKGLTTGG